MQILCKIIYQLEKSIVCKCNTVWQRDRGHDGPHCEVMYNRRLIADARDLRESANV